MKKLLIILAISFLFSCNKDDDNNTNVLVGKWKITEVRVKHWQAVNWNEWEPNYTAVKFYNFINISSVKAIFYDQTEDSGTYVFDESTNLITLNFPNSESPLPETKLVLISNENNILILENNTGNDQYYQFKLIKVIE